MAACDPSLCVAAVHSREGRDYTVDGRVQRATRWYGHRVAAPRSWRVYSVWGYSVPAPPPRLALGGIPNIRVRGLAALYLLGASSSLLVDRWRFVVRSRIFHMRSVQPPAPLLLHIGLLGLYLVPTNLADGRLFLAFRTCVVPCGRRLPWPSRAGRATPPTQQPRWVSARPARPLGLSQT